MDPDRCAGVIVGAQDGPGVHSVPTTRGPHRLCRDGGIYIAMSLVWLRVVEGGHLDWRDLCGGVVSVLGACVILWGRRA